MTAEAVGPGARHRCAILGSPVSHSLSPVLHTAAYAELGLHDWSYERVEVREGELAGFVDGLDASWRGLSITMPLKSELLRLEGVEVSEVARLAGAGNTLVLDGPGGRRVDNTDVPGLVSALERVLDDGVGCATVLGSGATARSALVALARLGAQQVQVLARNPDKAHALRPLADALGLELVVLPWRSSPPDVDVLVSALTAGAVDDDLAATVGDSAEVVFDVLYDPWPTPLATAAARAGARVLDGLDLLVGQAVEQVALMTGHRPSPEALRAAGDAALAARNAGSGLAAP